MYHQRNQFTAYVVPQRIFSGANNFIDHCMYMLKLIFLSQVIFVFLLFSDMEMYANEVETREM